MMMQYCRKTPICWLDLILEEEFSTLPSKLKAIYTADAEKHPVLFSGQKTSCRVLMDFTSAIPADPRGTARSYTRRGSSRH